VLYLAALEARVTKYNIRKGNIMQHLIPSMQHLFAEKVDS